MSSTATSEEVLSIRDLNLAFRLHYYEPRTVRDLFIKAVGSPLDTFLRPQETLQVLRDINLSLRKGDRLAILGVNGSGKSSLCRCVAGMLKPQAGTIRIQGSCCAVFDTQVGVIPELTGRENAGLLALLLFPEATARERAELVREATEFSELGSFLDVPFEKYSQGMKARLFLSLVTARPADLLILDEVYDNTDRFFQRKMTERLLDFIHRSEAFIFVSHAPDLVRKLCNRAVVIHESRIAFDGPVDRALAAYDFLNGAIPEAPDGT